MADKKFSEFPVVVAPTLANITVVGLDEFGQNAQFAGDEFGGGVSAHPALTDRDLADQHPIAAITDLQTELDGKEPALGDPSVSGYVLSSTDTGTRSWVAQSGGGSDVAVQAEGVTLTTAVTLLNFEGAGVSVTEPIADQITVTIPGSALTTKGDLSTYSTTPTRLPVGADGKMVFADSTAATGLAWAEPPAAGLAHLADGEPILIVCIGDSNAAGSNDINTSLVGTNTNIFYWALATAGESYDIANLDWRNLDPNSTIRTSQQSTAAGGGVTMTGQLLGGSNPIDMMTAYALNEETTRKVYVWKTAMGLQQSQSWLSGSHAGYPYDVDGYTPTFGVNNASVQAAIAAYNTANPAYLKTFADIVIISLGANDIDDSWHSHAGVSGAAFYTKMQTIWDSMVTDGFLDPTYSQVFHVENVNNSNTEILAKYTPGWIGYNLMQANNSERYTLVSSLGAETIDSTNLHYTCEQYQRFGRTISTMAQTGTSPKLPVRPNTYVQTLAPVFGGSLDAGGFGITNLPAITSGVTATGGVDTAFIFDTTSTFSATDTLWSMRNAGTEVVKVFAGGITNFGAAGAYMSIGGFGINTSTVEMRLGTGVLSSGVAVTGSADTAFKLDTVSTFTSGTDTLLSIRNAGTEDFNFRAGGYATFGPAGAFFSIGGFGINTSSLDLHLTTGVLVSAVPTGSAVGFTFTTAALTTGDKLLTLSNNGTTKLNVGYDGGIEAIGSVPGTTGTLILRPDTSLGTEQLEITSFGHSLTMKWVPTATNASAWLFQNNSTDNASGNFQFNFGTQHTSGQLWTLANAGAGTLVRFNYLGSPGFWGVTPATARVTGGANNNTPSTAGSGAITINSTSLWNGGSGTGYSIADLVKAMKDAGLIAA